MSCHLLIGLRAKEWKDILLIVELLFCWPISNTAVERVFSLLNRVKTDGHASLGDTIEQFAMYLYGRSRMRRF